VYDIAYIVYFAYRILLISGVWPGPSIEWSVENCYNIPLDRRVRVLSYVLSCFIIYVLSLRFITAKLLWANDLAERSAGGLVKSGFLKMDFIYTFRVNKYKVKTHSVTGCCYSFVTIAPLKIDRVSPIF